MGAAPGSPSPSRRAGGFLILDPLLGPLHMRPLVHVTSKPRAGKGRETQGEQSVQGALHRHPVLLKFPVSPLCS